MSLACYWDRARSRDLRRAVLATLLFAAVPAHAAVLPTPPESKRGVEPYRAYELGDVDVVNLYSGNLSVALPVSPTYPVAVGVTLGMLATYNSKSWESHTVYPGDINGPTVAIAPDMLANAGVGWRVSLGMLLRPNDPRVPGTSIGGVVATWFYIAPDGADLAFFADNSGNCSEGACHTRDSSYIRLRQDGCERWVEFPDGSRHKFEPFSASLQYPEQCNVAVVDSIEDGTWPANSPNGHDLEWRLTAILGASAAEASPDITVTYDCPGVALHCAPAGETWEIEDRYARKIRVAFQADPSGIYPALVDKLTVPTFGGAEADYDFSYTARVLRPACLSNGTHTSVPPLVPTLDRIVQPDGSFYQMTYHLGAASGSSQCTFDAAGGALVSLRLPTAAMVSWEYDRRDFTVPACEANVWTTKSPAVSKRTVDDGVGTAAVWTYGGVLNQPTTTIPANQPEECNALNLGNHVGPSEEMQVFVTNPNNDRTIHYFSAYPGMPLLADDPLVSIFRREEIGLPFSRCVPGASCAPRNDGGTNPRFLSSEIQDCNPAGTSCATVRKNYVRYEQDTDCTFGAPPCDGKNNQRVQSTKTVYVDDPAVGGGSRATVVEHSGFDTVGHYRSTTYSSEQYGEFGTLLIDNTDWNHGRTSRPGPTERWLLNTFDSTERQTDKQTIRAEYQHDPNTGFVQEVRRLKSTANDPARSKADVIVRFTAENDGTGFVDQEEWFGGDCLGGVLPCPSDTIPSYTTKHTHEKGVRTHSAAKDGSATVLELLDIDVDPNTSLTVASRDPGGRTTSFDYDDMGRLLSVTPTGAAATTHSYSHPTVALPNTQLSVTSETADTAVLRRERWFLDRLGREIRHEVDAPGGSKLAPAVNAQATNYNPMGWKDLVTEWVRLDQLNGAAGTAYQNYDPFGRPQTIVRPDGSTTTMTYKGERLVERSTYVWTGIGDDPRGEVATTKEESDNLGRLRQVTEPNGRRTRYEYDPGGNLKHARPVDSLAAPQNRFFNYDGRGFLGSESHPESGKTTYLYDARGNAVVSILPTATLRTTYDKASRLRETRVVTGQGGQMDLLRKFDYFGPGAGVLEGELQQARAKNWRPIDGTCKPVDVLDTFGYDPAGRTNAKETQLLLDGALQEKWTQGYVYDGIGQATTTNYPNCPNCPSSARAVSTVFAFGRPQSIASGVQSFASSITYAGNSLYTTITHGDGTQSVQVPDTSGLPRPQRLYVTGAGSTWDDSYSYDESGNITVIGSQTFTYDRLSRLRSARIPDAASTESPDKYQGYSYDRFGNLTSLAQGATPGTASTTDFVVDPKTNRVGAGPTGTATYTASGSLKAWQGFQFTWDPLRQLAKVDTGPDAADETWTHTYDATGERVWSWRETGTRLDKYAFRGLDGKILREVTRTASGPATLEDYVYRDGSLLATVKPGGAVKHFHLDHLGSVRLITSGTTATKHQTWPYGVEFTSPADAEQMRFTGHERDLGSSTAETVAEAAEDDLDYMHARYYKPGWGRFLSVDPVLGTPNNPQSWNRYAYTRGNPLLFVDPSGRNVSVNCDPNRSCVASVDAQIVVDNLVEPALWDTAAAFRQGAQDYWNSQTVTSGGDTLTFNVSMTIAVRGSERSDVDTLTVVDGRGRSAVDQHLVGYGTNSPSPHDSGSIYTIDSTNNPGGMRAIGAHEAGHLMGMRDTYNEKAGPVPLNTSSAVDIMYYAQFTNSPLTAYMVLRPNGNSVITRQVGPPASRP
jgi:RHS repeat-associated protein